MSDDHTTTVDRLRQFRDSVTGSAADRIAEAAKSDAETRGTLLPGRRVLDRITGLDGVVLSRTAATPTPFGAFTIELDNGDVLWRFPRDLFARPTPPRA